MKDLSDWFAGELQAHRANYPSSLDRMFPGIVARTVFDIHFGSVKVGNSATKDVALSNTGTTALAISSIGTTGTDQNDFTASSNCPSALSPGHSCQIAVTFKPTQDGPRSANLTVTDNALINKQNVPLSGSGD